MHPLYLQRPFTAGIINRNLLAGEAEDVISTGEVIADYDTDKPYPGKLMLKFVNQRPVHAVVAQNSDTQECIIITATFLMRCGGIANSNKKSDDMKCVICKVGETHKGKASFTVERNGAFLVFANVDADVCDNCGEAYFDSAGAKSSRRI